MFLKSFSAFLFAALLSPGILAADEVQSECGAAGPDAYFCFGDAFTKLDVDHGEGVSFWVHKTGFLSKVLVEDTGGKDVTQGQIERQILALVSEQAEHFGRDFAFSDLSATTVGGVPFGTFSYRLRGATQEAAVLHSYVAVKGRVLQVVSQLLLKSADTKANALEEAHAAALRAVKLEDPSSDA